MDTGLGYITPIDKEKALQVQAAMLLAMRQRLDLEIKGSGVFEIGEVVELKGSSFRITNISAHKLTLTVLKETKK